MNRQGLIKVALSLGFYIVFAILVVTYSSLSSNFLTGANLKNILLNTNSLFVMALGETLVILTGGLDLSVGQVGFVSSAVCAILIAQGSSIWVGLSAAVLTGLVIGLVNAVLIAVIGANSMLTTLGMMIGLEGLGLTLINGSQISIPPVLANIDSIAVFRMPILVIFVIALLVISQIALSRSTFGRTIIAVGCNSQSVDKLGLKSKRIKFIVYMISSLTATLAGLIFIINQGSVTSYMEANAEFTAIAVVVLGGTSLFGGEGSIVPGTLFGALMLSVIQNGLNLTSASAYAYPFITGIIILVAIWADTMKLRARLFTTKVQSDETM